MAFDGRLGAANFWTMLSRSDAGPPGARTVAIVGDSIIHSSTPEICKALTGSYCFTVRARTGAKIRDIAALSNSFVSPGAPARVDVVVVNVGTNDVTGRTSDWHEHWAALMDLLTTAPSLVLFTINRHSDSYGKRGLDGPCAEDINHAIAQTCEAGNVRVVDWDAAVQADVELVWDRSVHRGDFVHPSAKGQTWIADRIRAALHDCSGAVA
jgi:lysophospholipase L1-like esterase